MEPASRGLQDLARTGRASALETESIQESQDDRGSPLEVISRRTHSQGLSSSLQPKRSGFV